MNQPLNPKSSKEIVVEKFHHILIWPLIMRGKIDFAEDREHNDQGMANWVSALNEAQWQEVASAASTAVPADLDIQEVIYFHPFVRDFLYGDGLYKQSERALRRFAHQAVKRCQVTLRNENKTTFNMKVERAELYLCKPHVMLFCLELSNRDSSDNYVPCQLNDVHDFRDQIRRVYPPFWFDSKQKGDLAKEAGLCPLAVQWDSSTQAGDLCIDSPKGNFEQFTRVGAEPPVFTHWQYWFGSKIKPLQRLLSKDELKRGMYYQQVMDDRMQCLSYLAFSNPDEISEGDRDRLTFVDAAGDDEHPYHAPFLARFRADHTYDRFNSPQYQTVYYLCTYAFTAVGRSKDCFYSTIILDHFRKHYYRMGIVAHYQRAALLHFSDEMATAAKELVNLPAEQEPNHAEYRQTMNRIQMYFLKFRSRSYFPEVTNQQQGCELNQLWHKHLAIKELFAHVDDTCDQINQVLSQKAAECLAREQSKLAHEQRKLAYIAKWGLGISIVLALVGAFFQWVSLYPEDTKEVFPVNPETKTVWGPIIWMGMAAVLAFLSSVGLVYLFQRISKSAEAPKS